MAMRIMLMAFGGLVLGAGGASAHAFLKTASPAVGSTVQSAPAEVVITFTEGLEPRFSTIVVQDAAGKEVQEGAPHLAGTDTHLAVALGKLPAGLYKVTWHATATDTHKTSGSFNFTVAP